MWWENSRRKEFERLMLPPMPAAYRLAYAIVRSAEDAADVVQEAYLHAWAAFAQYRGEGAVPWLLAIVRNTALRSLRARGRQANVIPFEPAIHATQAISADPSPELVAGQQGELECVQRWFIGRSCCSGRWRGCRIRRWQRLSADRLAR